MGSLILASREDVLSKYYNPSFPPLSNTVPDARPCDFKKSVIDSPLLLGPPRSSVLIGDAPLSGLHYDPANGSILEQFPSEILDKVLMLLEPIWLFQLERAVKSIADYLTSWKSNPIWVCMADLICDGFCHLRSTQVLAAHG